MVTLLSSCLLDKARGAFVGGCVLPFVDTSFHSVVGLQCLLCVDRGVAQVLSAYTEALAN